MAIFFTGNEFYDEPGIIEKFHRPFMKKVRELTEEDIENGYFDIPEFPDYELMRKTLIDNFNQKVHHGDMTFHIGNFGNLEVADELNGDHYLIIGKKEADVINSQYGTVKKYAEEVCNKYNFKNVLEQHSMKFVIQDPSAYHKLLGDQIARFTGSYRLFMISFDAVTLVTRNNFTLALGDNGFLLSPDSLDQKKFDTVMNELNPGVDMHHFSPISEKELREYIIELTKRGDK